MECLWRMLKTKQHVRKNCKSTRPHKRKPKSIKNLQKKTRHQSTEFVRKSLTQSVVIFLGPKIIYVNIPLSGRFYHTIY